MSSIKSFTFNPFSENTYLLVSDSDNVLIFDPGCYEEEEKAQLDRYLEQNSLTPKRLINTHCHIDHVLGNSHIIKKYGLDLECHPVEEQVLKAVGTYAQNYGFANYSPSVPAQFLNKGDKVELDDITLEVLFVPGHSPGHLVFYYHEKGYCIGGDVLFQNSIGRTDLPGGDHDLLLKKIREQLFVLPDETVIYPGHGPKTTIGNEKRNNPFFK